MDIPMLYILTNSQNECGATYMFDESVMDFIAESLNDDVVILPASVNEVLVFGKRFMSEPESLQGMREMVKETNQTLIPEEEILSDEIYLYDKATQKLSIIETNEQQLGMSMNMQEEIKVKNATVTIKYEEEKLNALKQYMEKKDANLEEELGDVLGKLYEKYVPQAVREYIESRADVPPAIKKARKKNELPL